MKKLTRIFFAAICMSPVISGYCDPLSGTAGSNLTAWNGSMGSINNNQWNNLTNNRSATADFGNCNSVILRCAQPKCASGGCISMEIAYPIVQGCVMSNEACSGHGDSLIQAISAQLVASSTAKANESAANAAAAAATSAANQSAQQIQMMQSQIEQMQYQSQQQSAQTAAAVQAALDEQRQLSQQTAAQQLEMAAANAPTAKIETAIQNNVSAEVLVREQAGNKILSELENSEDALAVLKKTMQNVFDYAKCDASGNNCEGPARVAVFKEKSNDFFEPYNDVLDEVYDALILAQSLGVDITDIYMMLNGTCNVWGRYLCTEEYVRTKREDGTYSYAYDNEKCELLELITDENEVEERWLNPDINRPEDDNGKTSGVHIKCASDALDNSPLFKNRRKSSNIGIDLLQQIIEQDSPSYGNESMPYKYCFNHSTTKDTLQKQIGKKRFPDKVCAKSSNLLPVTAITATDSVDSETGMCEDFVNPDIAMCTTHAYNSGKIDNDFDASTLTENRELIALKTTLITLEMDRQYNYLASTLSRFKTQLEKAILTAQMQAAGATDEESSYSGNTLTGINECNRLITFDEKNNCLRNNYTAIGYATNYGESINTATKEQLAKDYTSAISLATSLNKKPTENAKCGNKSSINNKETFKTCLNLLASALGEIADGLTNKSNQSSGGQGGFGSK